ncbi:hypothetical protein CYI55_06870 [Campylobacter upsaliensis]|nr:hypothetical protein [Campylobacter upsaliensis]EAK4236161.1 hypothetical protein [Campylobacter upsaliensis]
MKDFDFLRKVNLKGKIWLNAEHLGGCAFRAKKFKAKHGFAKQRDGLGFRFLLRRCLATHRTGCERYRLRSYFRADLFA